MSTVQERQDFITPGPAEGLAGLLDVPTPDLDDALPPLWHWVYLLSRPAQVILGPDGHPVRGEIPAPPRPGKRRMFAGGRVRVVGGLRPGIPAVRRSRVVGTQDKKGKLGPLTFITVGHEIVQDDRVVVAEEQDIVYRDAPARGQARVTENPSTPPLSGDRDSIPVDPVGTDETAFAIDPTVLFRFSALTYNAHRIHYDRDYVTGTEGYPGLVVHGPLQALLMAEHARRGVPAAAKVNFEFRMVAPLFDHQGLVVGSSPSAAGVTRTWVRDFTGRVTATGSWQDADRSTDSDQSVGYQKGVPREHRHHRYREDGGADCAPADRRRP